MENTKPRERKVIKISRKKLFVLIVILVLGFLYLTSNRRPYYLSNMMGSTESARFEKMNPVIFPDDSYSSRPDSYYPPSNPGNDFTIKDTREFMKVNYGAEIKTRNVKDVMHNVKNAIENADGRMDNVSETREHSQVSFVIPKTNLNDFKDEIESLTYAKLFFENSSSQNLLGQKQMIEQQAEYAANYLAELQKNQKDLNTEHTKSVNTLQKELTSIQNQLIVVRTTILNTTDANTLVTLRNQEASLVKDETSLKASLSTENKNYANNSQNLQNQIDNANAQIKNVVKQDENFKDNIETVSGYVYVNWISYWDMAKLLSPIHPGIIVGVLVLLAWYQLTKKNYLPHFEFV